MLFGPRYRCNAQACDDGGSGQSLTGSRATNVIAVKAWAAQRWRMADGQEPALPAVAFTPPKQWEDWCDWALGFWLVLSPWILDFQYQSIATRNAVVVGGLVIFAEVMTLSVFRVWEEWINVALGAWLAVSPFVLGIDGVARVNFLVAGAIIAALALYEVAEVAREPERARPE